MIREIWDMPHSPPGEANADLVRRAAEKHPEIVSLVPALLDRGDEAGRKFAWHLARELETPDMLAALRDFALGQRGPDALRMETLSYLCRMHALSSDRARVWLEGTWREIEAFRFEVSDEPVDVGHSPEVDDLGYEAIQATNRHDGETAERLLRRAIELEPEHPDLINNLAMAFRLQHRNDEAKELLLDLHRRWPDYFFGRIARAGFYVEDRETERAEQMLDSLRQRSQRLHTTEFRALCIAYLQLFIGGATSTALGAGSTCGNRSSRTIRTWSNLNASLRDVEEIADRGVDDVGLLQRRHVTGIGHGQEASPGKGAGQAAHFRHRGNGILLAADHQGGHANPRQEVRRVGPSGHSAQSRRDALGIAAPHHGLGRFHEVGATAKRGGGKEPLRHRLGQELHAVPQHALGRVQPPARPPVRRPQPAYRRESAAAAGPDADARTARQCTLPSTDHTA